MNLIWGDMQHVLGRYGFGLGRYEMNLGRYEHSLSMTYYDLGTS